MKLLKVFVVFAFMAVFLVSTANAAKLDLSRILVVYLCDEGSGEVLKDSSGNKWDAEIPNAKWENGVFGKAVRIQKTNSEVRGDIVSSVGITGEISMMCWINMSAHSTYNGLISIEAPNEGDVCCEFRLMINSAKSPF